MTQNVNVEKPNNRRKNHGSLQTAENHYESNTTMGKHRGNDLLHPFFVTRRLQWTQRHLSLSLSLHTQLHAHYRTNNVQLTIYCFCPKSYLYTYDFRLFTHMAQKAQSNIFTYVSLPTGREDHHRVLDHPVSRLSAPDRCVSRVGTAEVLD